MQSVSSRQSPEEVPLLETSAHPYGGRSFVDVLFGLAILQPYGDRAQKKLDFPPRGYSAPFLGAFLISGLNTAVYLPSLCAVASTLWLHVLGLLGGIALNSTHAKPLPDQEVCYAFREKYGMMYRTRLQATRRVIGYEQEKAT